MIANSVRGDEVLLKIVIDRYVIRQAKNVY